jgi:hypothetical protein
MRDMITMARSGRYVEPGVVTIRPEQFLARVVV